MTMMKVKMTQAIDALQTILQEDLCYKNLTTQDLSIITLNRYLDTKTSRVFPPIPRLNSKKHHEISRTILADKSENMQSSQTTRTVTINNNPVGQNQFQNVQKTAVSENQVSFGNLAGAPTGLSCLFGGPIYGGTFNINMSNLSSLSPSPQATKRRRYVIESDSSQE
ncbi:Hypothetical predicted protein [Mytilus galloprovincialis]|uniref:Uncharacterized protein n=1 Tax=Mytilus galloprovincialis TaxID=29158 RepID=A0A8B6DWR0_MYTGA|nr:Hypothetical predicted protein [Mytilus galloprovincialis]